MNVAQSFDKPTRKVFAEIMKATKLGLVWNNSAMDIITNKLWPEFQASQSDCTPEFQRAEFNRLCWHAGTIGGMIKGAGSVVALYGIFGYVLPWLSDSYDWLHGQGEYAVNADLNPVGHPNQPGGQGSN